MKKIIFLLALLLAFAYAMLLPACHKDDPGPSKIYGWRFSGKVLEYGSGKPIPNASVRVRLCESEFLGPVSCYTLKTDTTDSQGKYSLDHDSEELFLYIDATADQYYPFGQEKLLNRGEEKGHDLTLIAHSKMRLSFRNERDSTVYFSYQVGNQYFPQIKLEPFQDTSKLFEMGGNLNSRIYYSLFINVNNGTKERFVDSVKCPPHDILIKEIIF